eukprot:IDg9810t1
MSEKAVLSSLKVFIEGKSAYEKKNFHSAPMSKRCEAHRADNHRTATMNSSHAEDAFRQLSERAVIETTISRYTPCSDISTLTITLTLSALFSVLFHSGGNESITNLINFTA